MHTLICRDNFMYPKLFILEELLMLLKSGVLVINAYDDINPYWDLAYFWGFSIFSISAYMIIILIELLLAISCVPSIVGSLCGVQSDQKAEFVDNNMLLAIQKIGKDKAKKAQNSEFDPELVYRQQGFNVTGEVLQTEERGIYVDAIIEEMIDKEAGDKGKELGNTADKSENGKKRNKEKNADN